MKFRPDRAATAWITLLEFFRKSGFQLYQITFGYAIPSEWRGPKVSNTGYPKPPDERGCMYVDLLAQTWERIQRPRREIVDVVRTRTGRGVNVVRSGQQGECLYLVRRPDGRESLDVVVDAVLASRISS